MSRCQSVLGIHRTGPGEKSVSDPEGDKSLGLVAAEKTALEGVAVERLAVERIAFERVVVDRVLVDKVPVEKVVLERIASCHPIHGEHWKDLACHLGVDPSQPLDECWDRLD